MTNDGNSQPKAPEAPVGLVPVPGYNLEILALFFREYKHHLL